MKLSPDRILRRIWKSVSRRGLRLLFFLSEDRKRNIERWLRGKEEHRRLEGADFVIVSYPKSGRTWLRVMLSRYFQLRYGIPDHTMLGYDNFHDVDARVPKIFFTHDNYLRDYTGNGEARVSLRDKKVVLLVRTPQDVVTSSFFQWKHRTRASKKYLNQLPPHGADISMFEFAMTESIGLPRIVRFLNKWSRELPQIRELLVVRYEDMRAHPEREFGRIAEFVDGPSDESQAKCAVEFASISNTRKLEARDKFWTSGSRLTPGDRNNPDSYKVRRAKVGGYRDYFDDDELDAIDGYVRSHLAAGFGYETEALSSISGGT